MKKIYVGNLSYNVDEDALREYFEGHGEIEEAVVIKERDTGRSKGFGFVTYASEEQAKAAVEAEDGRDMGGRPLRVSIAREVRRDRGGSGGGGGDRDRW